MTDYRDLERSRIPPTVNRAEMHRFEFWKPHATPIPASLLNLTGWLGQNPSRLLAVERPGGAIAVPASDIRPEESVLFRLDKPGTRERADWEAYFAWVTILQAHEWTVDQLKAEAKAKMALIDEKISALEKQREEAERAAAEDQREYDAELDRLRLALRARARQRIASSPRVTIPAGALGDPGGTPVTVEVQVGTPAGPEIPLTADAEGQRWVENAKQTGLSLVAKWDAVWRDFDRRLQRLQAERKPYELEVARLELESTRRVYAGLFARINAFLHVQALSAATIAIEEYRTNPRHESALAEEMERRLAVE